MRYREGTPLDQIGPSPEAGIYLLAAALGVLIGVVLVIGGLHGRQRWLVFWGTGLVFVALYYIVAYAMGLR
jgi:hypothetical protein